MKMLDGNETHCVSLWAVFCGVKGRRAMGCMLQKGVQERGLLAPPACENSRLALFSWLLTVVHLSFRLL